MTAFALSLVNAMRSAKMSRAELARRIGVSRASLTDYCKSRQRPRPEVLRRINEVLKTELTLARKLTAEEVARGLGLHPDTLRRVMREEGLFQDIGVAIRSRGGQRWCYRFYVEPCRLKLGI